MRKTPFGLMVLACTGILATCTPAPRFTSTPETPGSPAPNTASPGDAEAMPALSTRFSSGESFVGIASYYGPKFHGRRTANGETFDMYGITAAHKTLPFNTVVRVTNLKNNQSTLVRINDRGPFIPGRVLDLSYGAAKKIGLVVDGTGRVRIEVIELGDDGYAR